MSRKLLFFFLFILLLSACTRTASDTPPTELPVNFPSPAPGSTPLCQPADLGISSNSIGATGALMLGVTLTNKSKNPCALMNPPQVIFLDDKGQPLKVQASNAPGDQTPVAPQMELGPGESAIASLVWRNYCQPLANDDLNIRLELSAGVTLDFTMKLLSEPRCDSKSDPSTLVAAPYSYPP